MECEYSCRIWKTHSVRFTFFAPLRHGKPTPDPNADFEVD